MIDFSELAAAENEVVEQTLKEFPKTVSLSENAIGLLLNMVQVTANEKAVSTREYGGYSVFILSNRMIRVLSCAHNAIMKGYYEIGMGTLRFAFETHLLMNYLRNRNDEAKKWLDGKSYSPSYLRPKVKTSYREVYSLLSGFAHANASTCKSWFFADIGHEKAEFSIGEFNRMHFLYTAKHLIAIQFGTIALVATEFAPAFVSGNKAVLEHSTNWVMDYRIEMAVINGLLKSKKRK